MREPQSQGQKQDGAGEEFDGDGGAGGREKGFQRAGDDEQRHDAGEEADGFGGGSAEGVAAGVDAGEEEAGGEAEAGPAGDKDAGQLQGAVGGNEAPELERHASLSAGHADDAHHEAVEEDQVQRAEAGEDAAGESGEADADVVGHDPAGSLRLHADEALSPHPVVLDGDEDGGAEEEAHECGAGEGDERAERASGEEEEEGCGDPGEEAAEDAGVVDGEEAKDLPGLEFSAGVDAVVRPGQELVQVFFLGAGAAVGAYGGEILGGLAVEQTQLAEFVAGKGFEAGGLHVVQQVIEALPQGLPLFDPAI